MNIFDFYKQHSTITDPGEYAYLFDDVPADCEKIKEILWWLILHFVDILLGEVHVSTDKLIEIETRYVNDMLKIIISRDKSSLLVFRPPEKRLVGSCRDYAVLFCSILRHHGVPARTRTAFNTYYFKGRYHDGIIVEYWNKNLNRWCFIDPRTTESLIKKQQMSIDFDLLDVPSDKLIVAGLAWQMARKDPSLADRFCSMPMDKNRGFWYIRDKLIQDVASLNNVEMLLWDGWGLMLKDHDFMNDYEQVEFLDYLADLTVDPNNNLEEIKHIYKTDMVLTVPKKIISYGIIHNGKEIEINI